MAAGGKWIPMHTNTERERANMAPNKKPRREMTAETQREERR